MSNTNAIFHLDELVEISFRELIRDYSEFKGKHYLLFKSFKAKTLVDQVVYILEPTKGILAAPVFKPDWISKETIKPILAGVLKKMNIEAKNSVPLTIPIDLAKNPIKQKGKPCKLIKTEKINEDTYLSIYDWSLIIT
jgi:hypothetical protein